MRCVITLRADETGIRIRSDISRSTRRLGPGKAWSVAWTLCGRTPGAYVILAAVRLGETTVESPGRLLVITPGSGSSC